MRVIIKKNYKEIAQWVVEYIQQRIANHRETLNTNNLATNNNNPFVLGLPTGGTIEKVYEILVENYKQGAISFRDVATFNMDEYVGLAPEHPQSYAYFMHSRLFDHIDIPKENIHIPKGLVKTESLELCEFTESYEKQIADLGGIDVFIGGLGSNAHLAFNEPFSSLSSLTREKTLSHDTVLANSRYFDSPEEVPKTAITVGIDTVMKAHTVVLLVSGEAKAEALQRIVEGGVNHMYPASILQMHKNAIIVCDEDATDNLMVKTYKFFTQLHHNNLL